MRPSELEGKKVIATEAKIVGTVLGIEIDCSEWKVTDLRIELTDESVETLGYKKPFLGHLEILLSMGAVKSIADVVALDKSIRDLRHFIKPPK